MLIFGASGHAKVIIEALESKNVLVNAVFDDDIHKKNILDYPVIGKYRPEVFKDETIIIAIGDNDIRKRISVCIKHHFGSAIHASAILSSRLQLGVGNAIMAGCIIQSETLIGNHCIINTGSKIDHDCQIGDYTHIAPNSTVCGGVRIGQMSLIGANTVVKPNITVGDNVIVGIGSVIVKDIPDNVVVFGNPAKIVKIKNES